MNDFEIKRNIKTTCWKVLGTIGLPQKREHLLMILKLAEEKGSIDAEMVADELLGPNRDAIADRLLFQCKRLGLLNKKNELTDTGKKAVYNNMVYTPVNGEWKIWTIDDALLPSQFLKIEKIDRDEKNYNSKENVDSQIEYVDLPGVIEDSKLNDIELLFGEISDCRVFDLKGKCTICEKTDEKVEVSLSAKNNKSEAYIAWNGMKRKIRELNEQPNQIYENIILNSEYEDYWRDNCLLISYEGLSDKEKNKFIAELEFKRPRHSQYGEFEDVYLSTPIYPETYDDLGKWAEWLLSQKIVDFIFTEEDYQAIKTEVMKQFPYNNPEMKSLYEKIDEYFDVETGKRNEKYWYLQAANDWKLEGVR